MKRLIALILILLACTVLFGAVNQVTKVPLLNSRSVAADTVYSHGSAGHDTIYVNLFDYIYGAGMSVYFDTLRAQYAVALGSDVLTDLTGTGLTVSGGGLGVLWTWLYGFIDTTHALSNKGYLTANQSISLSGDISGSGTTAITTTIGSGKVTSGMIVDGTIAAADIAANVIDSTKLMPNCIFNSELATQSVKKDEIDSTVAVKFNTVRIGTADYGEGAMICPDSTRLGAGDSAIYIDGNGKVYLHSCGNVADSLATTRRQARNIAGDTITTIIPAEWAGSVLIRGFGRDTIYNGYTDSMIIRGGADINGNYVEFFDSIPSGFSDKRHTRYMQISIPAPENADSLKYILPYFYVVGDGGGTDSVYFVAMLQDTSVTTFYSATPIDVDSGNTTSFTNVVSGNASSARCKFTTYPKSFYLLIRVSAWEKLKSHVYCYRIVAVWHRRQS